MKKQNVLTLSALVFSLTAGIASASTININTKPGTEWQVAAIETWNTTGNTMDGISITASGILNGGGAQTSFTETLSWANGAGVTGSGWSLKMNDYSANTWDTVALWNLAADSNYSITSLIIDGKSGNTVFDIFFPGEGVTGNTPKSEQGQEIWQPNLDPYPTDNYVTLTVNAIYSNRVSVIGSPAIGDLYQTLTLDFVNGFSGGTNTPFIFSLDTDNVAPVPEPATMLLFGAGLAGLAGARRFRKKQTTAWFPYR